MDSLTHLVLALSTSATCAKGLVTLSAALIVATVYRRGRRVQDPGGLRWTERDVGWLWLLGVLGSWLVFHLVDLYFYREVAELHRLGVTAQALKEIHVRSSLAHVIIGAVNTWLFLEAAVRLDDAGPLFTWLRRNTVMVRAVSIVVIVGASAAWSQEPLNRSFISLLPGLLSLLALALYGFGLGLTFARRRAWPFLLLWIPGVLLQVWLELAILDPELKGAALYRLPDPELLDDLRAELWLDLGFLASTLLLCLSFVAQAITWIGKEPTLDRTNSQEPEEDTSTEHPRPTPDSHDHPAEAPGYDPTVLRNAMVSMGLRVEDLAERARMDRRTVQRYLNETYRGKAPERHVLQTVVQLARVLGRNHMEFFTTGARQEATETRQEPEEQA